jgi:hypothetical protein
MARTVVGYNGANGINNMASASSTGSVEAVTGLPIATGLVPGAFFELSASEAALYSYQLAGVYTWGQLYDGVFMWVQLDPAVSTDPIPLGTVLSWLQAGETTNVFPQVTTVTANNTDFAGVTIDSNFGKSHPYAFIQCQGKVAIQYDNSATFGHIGDYASISTGTLGSATCSGAVSTAATALQLGTSLVTSGTPGTGSRILTRVTRAISRF